MSSNKKELVPALIKRRWNESLCTRKSHRWDINMRCRWDTNMRYTKCKITDIFVDLGTSLRKLWENYHKFWKKIKKKDKSRSWNLILDYEIWDRLLRKRIRVSEVLRMLERQVGHISWPNPTGKVFFDQLTKLTDPMTQSCQNFLA